MMIILIVLTGVMAGIYFSFSIFIMKSLATLDSIDGARAMNAINRIIVKTAFLPLFFASTILYGVRIVQIFFNGLTRADYMVLAAASLYIGGMFIVTVAGNVPLNNALQAQDDNDVQLESYWPYYVQHWTRLNHIRTLSCMIATVLLGVSF